MSTASGPDVHGPPRWRRFFDWFFRDRRTGAVVIGQWPNLPLWLFAAATLLNWVVDATALAAQGWIGTGLSIFAAAVLSWWALDEILRGVNPWRRCLGGGVLLFYGVVALATRF